MRKRFIAIACVFNALLAALSAGLSIAKQERSLEYHAALDQIPAWQKLLHIDTCQSGEAPSLLGYEVSQRRLKEVEGVLSRAPSDSKEKGTRYVRKGEPNCKGLLTTMAMAFDLKEMGEMFPELRRGTGTIEISAATGVQAAIKDGRWENGAFTYAVKEF